MADVRWSETNSKKLFSKFRYACEILGIVDVTSILIAVWQPFVILLSWYIVGVIYNISILSLSGTLAVHVHASCNCLGKHVHSFPISCEVKICSIWHSNGLLVKLHLARSNKLAFQPLFAFIGSNRALFIKASETRNNLLVTLFTSSTLYHRFSSRN